MKRKMWIRLSIQELLGQKKFCMFFVLNLMVGLLGFVALETVKSSVESTLEQSSRKLMGADLSISGRRDITKSERAILESKLEGQPQSLIIQVYSMIVSSKESRLVQLRGLGSEFPFYGHFNLQNKGAATGRDLHEGNVWIYPELLAQLNVNIGDSIKIGAKSFRIEDVIVDDVGAVWSTFALAPRVYISLDELRAVDLIKEGSLATYYYLYKIEDQIDRVSSEIQTLLTDPAIRVTTHQKAGEQSAKFLGYFSDYLSLIAIVALILSSIGSVFLIRGFLQSKMRELSILISLGLDVVKAQGIFVFQIFILCLIASVLAFIIGPLLFLYISTILADVLSLYVTYQVSLQTVLVLFIIGVVGNLLIFLPLFIRLRSLSPSYLFQETTGRDINSTSSGILAFLPGLIYFWGLSVLQSHSIKNGSYFFIGILASGLALYAFGVCILKLLEATRVKSLGFSMSIRNLARSKQATISSFMALSLGAVILSLIPQIEASLKSEIQQPEKSMIPSLFLFDIQEEQIKDLQSVVKSQDKELSQLSPLIRARLEKINGREMSRENTKSRRFFREDEASERSQNRGFNLSYRQRLSSSEEIVSGREFSTYIAGEGLPEISVEERFAESLGVKLGDKLQFDIQGVQIEGDIVNFRRVKWASFQPNFFVQFQEGVLNLAPKTYLASISKLTQDERVRIQGRIAETLSNISIIDVSRVLDKILELMKTISVVLGLMAGLSLVTGLVVLVAIVSYQVQAKFAEMTLLKVLGASPFQLQKLFVMESLLIGFSAGVLGAGLGLLFSFALSRFIFDGVWVVDTSSLLWVVGLLTVLSGLGAYLGSLFILKRERAF